MKKRFCFSALVLSMAFAALGMPVSLAFEKFLTAVCNSSLYNIANVILAGFFAMVTLLLGYLGLQVGLWLNRKKYRAEKQPKKFLILALAGAFITGALCQVLFGLEYQTFSRTVQVDTQKTGAHVVLLMDKSNSMYYMQDACDEAACGFVDSLDENISVQFIAFAAGVKDENVSDFLVMTVENKEYMKDFIRAAEDEGGTDFDEVLEKAIDTLNTYADPAYKPIIIMLTDGVDDIEDTDILQTLQDTSSDISFFSVRLTEDDAGDRQDHRVQALITLAHSDFPITPNADGTVDINTVMAAFRDAMASASTIVEEYQKLVLGEDFLLAEHESSVLRVVARMLFCIAYTVLAAVAYYGKPDGKSLVVNGVVGTLCGAVMAFTMVGLGTLSVWILCLGAFAIMEEVPQHV